MAYLFDATTEVISGTKVGQSAGDWSVMYWMAPTAPGSQSAAFWTHTKTGVTGYRKRSEQQFSDHRVYERGTVDAVSLTQTPTPPQDGSWTQVIVDYDSTAQTMAVFFGDVANEATEAAYDGAQTVGSDRFTGDINWFVGNNPVPDNNFPGSIEHVCLIEGRKATSAERTSHWQGSNVTGSGVTLMLPLRDDALDVSGNGNNGTVTGATTTTGPTYPSGGAAPQFARPTGTAVTAGWTASGAASIAAALAETVASDVEYARSEDTPSGSACIVPLTSGDDPGVDSGYVLRYRYDREIVSGAPTVNLTVQLREGAVSEASLGTLIQEWTHNNVTDGLVTAAQSVTNASAIVDHGALSMRFVATQA